MDLAAAVNRTSSWAGGPLDIDFTKVTLDNGLDVILHEDHDLPIVAVNLWYHVGSKNERPGLTGFAHLFEHLMFEGSQHHDKGFFPPLQEAGASLNGSTNADRTNYWEVVPTNALELALWLESDRMGYLVPALTDEKFATQREVVLNERRQNYENRPYGMAGMAMSAAVYPPDHPYHWPTIGFPPDLRAASLADVRGFFERYYHPGNASLALAGDIDPARALDLVRAYFGDLPAGPAVARGHAAAEAAASASCGCCSRIASSCRASTSPGDRRRSSVPTTPRSTSSRTCSPTARRRGSIAAWCTSGDWRSTSLRRSSRSELEGLFQIAATAAPGHGLEEIDRVITETLGEVAADGATADELTRGLAQAEAHFVYRLQTVGGFSGKSDQLNAYNIFVADPGYFGEDLERYRRLTLENLRDAARMIVAERRVALSVVPLGQTERALAGSSRAVVS